MFCSREWNRNDRALTHGAVGCWNDPSWWTHPLNYFLFSQCSTTDLTKGQHIVFVTCLWDGAYKTTLAAN